MKNQDGKNGEENSREMRSNSILTTLQRKVKRHKNPYLINKLFQLELDLHLLLWRDGCAGLSERRARPRDGGRGSLTGLHGGLQHGLLGLQPVVDALKWQVACHET